MLGQVPGAHCNILSKEYRDIFGCEKCKVTFGFKYRFIRLEWLKRSSNGQLGNTTMLIVR